MRSRFVYGGASRAGPRVGGNSVDAVKAAHAAELAHVQDLLPSEEELRALLADAAAVVDRIITEGRALAAFSLSS